VETSDGPGRSSAPKDDQPAAAEDPSDLTDEQPVDDEVSHAERHAALRETLALVLLAVTAIMTAWCGFESSKWGGEMSVSFSRASTARIEAARQQGVANNARQQDLTIYSVYVQAEATGDAKLARYVQVRFIEWFRVAFDAWVAAGRPTKAPFAMPQYVPPGTQEAAAADQRADQLFAQAMVNNQRGDNYTLLTVLAALVLFFAAVSSRMKRPVLQWSALIFGAVLFLLAAVVVATFPVIV
jgi:hypothetical protein